MSEDVDQSEGEERRNVRSIRGLDEDLYRRFSSTAKEMGVTVGELMNVAMGRLLVSLDVGTSAGGRLSSALRSLGSKVKEAQSRAFKNAVEAVADFDLVTDMEELSVGRRDLEAAKRPLVFSNVKRLEFEDDVDWELLRSKVKSINVVEELVVPRGVPKLELAERCRMVKRIVERRPGGATEQRSSSAEKTSDD